MSGHGPVLELGPSETVLGWREVEERIRDTGAGAVLCRRTGLVPDGPSSVPVWIRVEFAHVSDGDLAVWRARAVRAVDWTAPPADEMRARRLLVAAAKAGLWSRVRLPPGPEGDALAPWLADNPNLVPVWDRAGREGAGSYAALAPVAGRPLAETLSDGDLLLELEGSSPKALSRKRLLDDGRRVTLGDALGYRFVAPGELSPERFEEVCRLVVAGGAVHERWLRHNLKRAFLLALAEERGTLAGFSSLKHPRPEYVERIREKLDLDITDFLERGYTSVRPEYRGLGIGTKLLEGLTARAGDRNIYSIIRDGDAATRTIARRNRTVRVAGFFSELMGEAIGLWMPVATAEQLGLAENTGTGLPDSGSR